MHTKVREIHGVASYIAHLRGMEMLGTMYCSYFRISLSEMQNMNEQDEDSGYFKLGDALDEMSYSYGVKDKGISALKLVGKGVFNIGRFAVAEVFPALLETTAKSVKSNANSSDELRDKANKLEDSADEWRQKFKSKDNQEGNT